MIPRQAPDLRSMTLLAASLLVTPSALALPEDAQQKIQVDSASADLFLDQGLIVYTGSSEKPACIMQGTLKICGDEIRIERAQDDNGSLDKVTATGNPATYEQQPEADQQIAYASGRTLVYDNVGRLITADGDAEFSQAGTVISHEHIEYNLDTRNARASGADGAQGRMTLPGNGGDE